MLPVRFSAESMVYIAQDWHFAALFSRPVVVQSPPTQKGSCRLCKGGVFTLFSISVLSFYVLNLIFSLFTTIVPFLILLFNTSEFQFVAHDLYHEFLYVATLNDSREIGPRWIGPRTVGPRVSYQVGLLSLGPIGPWEGRTQFLKGVYNSPFLILSWFFCQTFGWVIKLDCCLLGGRAQFLKGVYNSTFLILSWFFCQTFGWVIKFDCCLWALSGPERGGRNF